MQKLVRRRPSASMIIAIVALVFATSGTAVAMTKLVNGDKLIAKHTLSGNRLRNHTITAKQINKSKLGVVPSANDANYATDAGLASDATNATNATNAANATNAVRAQSSATTDDIKTWDTTASAGQTVTLLTEGPFTITGACTGTHASPSAATQVSTSEANSDLNSYESSSYDPFGPTDGAVDIGNTASGTDGWKGPYDGSDAMLSADGNTYVNTFTAVGTLLNNGADCTFVGYATVVTK